MGRFSGARMWTINRVEMILRQIPRHHSYLFYRILPMLPTATLDDSAIRLYSAERGEGYRITRGVCFCSLTDSWWKVKQTTAVESAVHPLSLYWVNCGCLIVRPLALQYLLVLHHRSCSFRPLRELNRWTSAFTNKAFCQTSADAPLPNEALSRSVT